MTTEKCVSTEEYKKEMNSFNRECAGRKVQEKKLKKKTKNNCKCSENKGIRAVTTNFLFLCQLMFCN